jgi:hypothetical protein
MPGRSLPSARNQARGRVRLARESVSARRSSIRRSVLAPGEVLQGVTCRPSRPGSKVLTVTPRPGRLAVASNRLHLHVVWPRVAGASSRQCAVPLVRRGACQARPRVRRPGRLAGCVPRLRAACSSAAPRRTHAGRSAPRPLRSRTCTSTYFSKVCGIPRSPGVVHELDPPRASASRSNRSRPPRGCRRRRCQAARIRPRLGAEQHPAAVARRGARSSNAAVTSRAGDAEEVESSYSPAVVAASVARDRRCHAVVARRPTVFRGRRWYFGYPSPDG